MTPGYRPIRDPFALLRELPMPRPFAWYGFIRNRRMTYAFACLALLVCLVLLPLLYSMGQVHNQFNADRIKPNQVLLFFGALIVVALVRYTLALEHLWRDSRTLARYGRIEEANLLWVISNPQRVVATYRFWTLEGEEIVRETVIDADGPHPLAAMSAGDTVPVLYDTQNPKRRNMLWAEIERYVALPTSIRTRLAARSSAETTA